MTRTKMLRRGLFAMVMSTALGFGAVQAFAAPTGEDGARRYCSPSTQAWCRDYCLSIGAEASSCYNGRCRCFYP